MSFWSGGNDRTPQQEAKISPFFCVQLEKGIDCEFFWGGAHQKHMPYHKNIHNTNNTNPSRSRYTNKKYPSASSSYPLFLIPVINTPWLNITFEASWIFWNPKKGVRTSNL